MEALESLELEVLELLLELVVVGVLRLLDLEVLVPEVLELPGLVVLEALELEELETLRSLEQLELEALELEELELLTLELEVLEALCGRDRTSNPCFSRFLVSLLLLAFLLPYCVRRNVVSLRLVLPRLFVLLACSYCSPCSSFAPSSSIPLRVSLPPPPQSSLPDVPDPESDHARAASLTVSCLLATIVTDPSFESTATSALVAELVDFAAASRLDYATPLVADSESACPPSVGGECALGTDVLEDRQEDFECLAAAIPRFASMLLAPEGDPDAPDIPTPHSYAEAIMNPYSSQ
ncbi:unnamed protein product [Closterium sp. NIES-54]